MGKPTRPYDIIKIIEIIKLVQLNSPGAMFPKKLFAEPQLYGELDDGACLKQRMDFRHRAPFFFLFISTQECHSKIFIRQKNEKQTGESDDKTKIVLFEFCIAFISILQYMVTCLKLF